MFELTAEQAGALNAPDQTPVRVVDPRTRREYVLVPLDEYDQLLADYDDTGFTRDELHALAWEAGRSIGWEEMDEFDDLPEES